MTTLLLRAWADTLPAPVERKGTPSVPLGASNQSSSARNPFPSTFLAAFPLQAAVLEQQHPDQQWGDWAVVLFTVAVLLQHFPCLWCVCVCPYVGKTWRTNATEAGLLP